MMTDKNEKITLNLTCRFNEYNEIINIGCLIVLSAKRVKIDKPHFSNVKMFSVGKRAQ